MPRPRSVRPSSARPARAAGADSGLQGHIQRLLADAAADQPLPTTRDLGRRLGVANSTVARLLRRMTDAGALWQHPTSGRYFPTGARLLVDRPKPIACLIRRLELGSELYRELLEGISAGSGAGGRTMLLWHDELLVNHPDPQQPPAFATVPEQQAILAGFLDRHGESAGGYILDHVWSDAALGVHAARLRPAVVLFRTCQLTELGNLRADFRAGALLALGHLLGRGYGEILPVQPFAGDPAVDEFAATIQDVARELGCEARIGRTVTAGTPGERRALARRLRGATRRTALLCPEDNVAMLLHAALRESQVPCPAQVGLLSAMGTDFATRSGLSCLRYDYRQLGRAAVDALAAATPVRTALEPVLFSGEST